MTTIIPTIITAVLTGLLCAAAGAAWGLSRHVELLDWLQARTIAQMQRAMRSLGYTQEHINMVIKRMGCRIMPPNIPRPKPHHEDHKAVTTE